MASRSVCAATRDIWSILILLAYLAAAVDLERRTTVHRVDEQHRVDELVEEQAGDGYTCVVNLLPGTCMKSGLCGWIPAEGDRQDDPVKKCPAGKDCCPYGWVCGSNHEGMCQTQCDRQQKPSSGGGCSQDGLVCCVPACPYPSRCRARSECDPKDNNLRLGGGCTTAGDTCCYHYHRDVCPGDDSFCMPASWGSAPNWCLSHHPVPNGNGAKCEWKVFNPRPDHGEGRCCK